MNEWEYPFNFETGIIQKLRTFPTLSDGWQKLASCGRFSLKPKIFFIRVESAVVIDFVIESEEKKSLII